MVPVAEERDLPVKDRRLSSVEKRRKRDGSNAVVGVLLALFALAGMYEVVNGESSTNSNPNRFAANGTSSTTVAPPTTPCIATPLAAVHVVSLLRATKHFPVSMKTSRGEAAPPGSCNEVTFADGRGQGLNQLVVYPTTISATAAATAAVNSTSVAVGRVVVDFDRSLTTYVQAYQTAIGTILSGSIAHTPSTAVTAAQAPA